MAHRHGIILWQTLNVQILMCSGAVDFMIEIIEPFDLIGAVILQPGMLLLS